MDAITALAASIDNPILRAIGYALDSSVAYGLVALVLAFIGEQRTEKRSKIIVSLVIAFLLAAMVKQAMARERPCTEQLWCLPDYSFPSIHVAVAFTLMTGFINKKSYLGYLVFALFIAFTRLNLGVHWFEDIAGALPIALISYYVTDIAWKNKPGTNASKADNSNNNRNRTDQIRIKQNKEENEGDKVKQEVKRQIFHICVGIATILFLFGFGREITIAAVFATLIIGTILINIRLLGVNIPVVVPLILWFEEHFERKDAPLSGWGSACYATGVLLALTFLTNINQIAATVLILGLGDGVSTIVGSMYGKTRLPYNQKKTLEGTVAFTLVSFAAYYFVGVAAIPIAIIAAIVESLPTVDDNLTVPIACTILFRLAV